MTFPDLSYMPVQASRRNPKGYPQREGHVMSDWTKIDTSKFTGDLAKAYKAFDQARQDMILQREILEDIMVKKLAKTTPRGQEPKFSYKWGLISFLMVDKKTKVTTTSGGFTL